MVVGQSNKGSVDEVFHLVASRQKIAECVFKFKDVFSSHDLASFESYDKVS